MYSTKEDDQINQHKETYQEGNFWKKLSIYQYTLCKRRGKESMHTSLVEGVPIQALDVLPLRPVEAGLGQQTTSHTYTQQHRETSGHCGHSTRGYETTGEGKQGKVWNIRYVSMATLTCLLHCHILH